jgi:NodT family efflux transporter outer membrane factor (OMF) lipoprotein
MQDFLARTPSSSRLSAAKAAIFCFLALSVCVLHGCTVGPKYVRPTVPVPVAYKETAPQQASDGSLWKTADPQDAAFRGNWWEIFQEPELNELESQLDLSNQNIAQAYELFMASRAQVREARSAYFPTVTTTPGYSRFRTSQSTGQAKSSPANPNSNQFLLPFNVSWEPDLWGRIRNTVHQNSYAAQVSAADLENQRLSEQAHLAVFYFQLRGQDALEDVFQKAVEVDRQSLELTRVLYRTGLDNDESVAQAEITLKSAEASATNAAIARAQFEHAIALLIGKPASTFSIPVKPLATTAPAVPPGLPSELLERRPDIAAAERTMAEANALIGVQTAAFYPTLTISAGAGLESPKFSQWFNWPSRFWSVGPSFSETLFDGNLRRATLAKNTALYHADVANYRQVVLTAFQQTEDSLAGLRLIGVQITQQDEAVRSAQRFYDLATVRYKTGLDPYLNIFTAQATLLSNQQIEISLRTQQLTTSVQLIEALGGGWNVSRLPSERAVAAKAL